MIDRNTFDLITANHGSHASWAVWGDEGDKPKSNMGKLDVLDPDKNTSLLNVLQPNVIMIGLNVARPVDTEQKPYVNFHDASPHANDFKIRYAFKDTPYYGAYMTDLIKNHVEVDSGTVAKSLKGNPILIQDGIDSFRRELRDLKAVRPTILSFGRQVHDMLSQYLNKTEYSHLVSLTHYSYRISKENYREKVQGKIEHEMNPI